MNLSWEFYEDNAEEGGEPEESGDRMKKLMKNTLVRTKSKFVAPEADANKKDIAMQLKVDSSPKKKGRRAMGRSFERFKKEDRRRISAQRVVDIKAQAEESLRSAFYERIENRHKLLVKGKVLLHWKAYIAFKKSLKGKK